MTIRHTQRELAEMEKSLDDDCTSLKAEILELCIRLGHFSTEAYGGGYQQTEDLRKMLQAQLTSIMDALQFLSNSAGRLIVAGREHEDS